MDGANNYIHLHPLRSTLSNPFLTAGLGEPQGRDGDVRLGLALNASLLVTLPVPAASVCPRVRDQQLSSAFVLSAHHFLSCTW